MIPSTLKMEPTAVCTYASLGLFVWISYYIGKEETNMLHMHLYIQQSWQVMSSFKDIVSSYPECSFVFSLWPKPEGIHGDAWWHQKFAGWLWTVLVQVVTPPILLTWTIYTACRSLWYCTGGVGQANMHSVIWWCNVQWNRLIPCTAALIECFLCSFRE